MCFEPSEDSTPFGSAYSPRQFCPGFGRRWVTSHFPAQRVAFLWPSGYTLPNIRWSFASRFCLALLSAYLMPGWLVLCRLFSVFAWFATEWDAAQTARSTDHDHSHRHYDHNNRHTRHDMIIICMIIGILIWKMICLIIICIIISINYVMQYIVGIMIIWYDYYAYYYAEQ